MRRRLDFSPEDIAPSREEVLRTQGVPVGATIPSRVSELIPRAIETFLTLSRPRAVFDDVTTEEFREIYPGEGRNDEETPLEGIFPDATRLALFAATVGEELSAEIQGLFDGGNLALAVMLDGAASEGAERLVTLLEQSFSMGDESPHSRAVLGYSPGYCGWHVSGQRRLFAALQPEEIGITLNSSCLMAPLKSVSGVLVAGPPDIHDFDDDFPCCGNCATRECRDRIHGIGRPS